MVSTGFHCLNIDKHKIWLLLCTLCEQETARRNVTLAGEGSGSEKKGRVMSCPTWVMRLKLEYICVVVDRFHIEH